MAVHALPAASALANSSRGIDGRREPSLEARSTGTDCCRNALCVPKTRFCNIGDEVRRGLAPRNLTAGNAGGGKDPDFWRAFEEGEVKVIDKGLQTPTRIRSLQRKLYRKANQKQVITLHIRPNSHEPGAA